MLHLFNYKDFISFCSRVLFDHAKPYNTLKGILLLLGFLLVFIPAEIINHLCLVLDELVYPKYKNIKVKAPIFIIGNPRSGTTFLQRTLSKDRDNITTMYTWEILFAPSILQKKFFRLLKKVFNVRKSSLKQEMFKDLVGHTLSLGVPEEDQFLLLHIWSTLGIWTTSGVLTPESERYVLFDEKVPKKRRDKIMNFYIDCVKRHMFVATGKGRNKDLIYLSKNPAATPKIKSLREHFPDARFVYLVRDPKQMIPSYISFTNNIWKILGTTNGKPRDQDFIINLAKKWYEYPLSAFVGIPEENKIIVRFGDLTKDPKKVIETIYSKFNLNISLDFAKELQLQSEKSKRYKSKHTYSLERLGLNAASIEKDFASFYSYYGIYK